MTDREFKKLNRADLINIIYELQKSEKTLTAELEQTKKALENRQLKIAEAGSIAEAALGVNEIFERAQQAADEYLQSIRNSNVERERILETAAREAEEIRKKAQRESDRMIEQATRAVAEKWEVFNQKVNYMLETHKELESLLKGNAK